MSKYTILEIGTGNVLAKETNMVGLKKAFRQAMVKFVGRDFVAMDYNGETYARFLTGKLMPGQHYRKFTQRGVTVKPKAIRQPAAPAPAPAPALPTNRDEYKAAQAKWITDNNIAKDSRVKITGKAAGYSNGWDDAWNSHTMDSEVGKTGYVEKIEFSGGIRVRTGCGRSFRYPFFVLEKA